MHDVAGTALEDREVLVLAFDRRAQGSAVLETRDPASEVPATGTLAEIAAERAHVPERRRARRRRTQLDEGGEIDRGRLGRWRCPTLRVAAPIRTPPSAVGDDSHGTGNRSEVDHEIRQADLFGDRDEQVRAPAERDRAGLGELLGGVVHRRGLSIEKGVGGGHRNKNGETRRSRHSELRKKS